MIERRITQLRRKTRREMAKYRREMAKCRREMAKCRREMTQYRRERAKSIADGSDTLVITYTENLIYPSGCFSTNIIALFWFSLDQYNFGSRR
jgi:hypothetical protein